MKQTIDLTNFLSDSLCQVLMNAAFETKRDKIEVIDEDYILLSLILIDRRTQEILSNSAQLDNIINILKNNIKSKKKWETPPKNIKLHKNIRKALILSLNESSVLNEDLISPLALLLSLSKMGIGQIHYEDLVKVLNVTKGIDVSPADKTLRNLIEDVTLTNQDALDKFIEYGTSTDQIIRILFKDVKKNIVLVGNDGIGKDSTKYILAKKALESNSILFNSKVYSIDTDKISYSNLTDIVKNIQSQIQEQSGKNKYIVYITNLEPVSEGYQESNIISTLISSISASNISLVITINYTKYQVLLKNYQSLLNNSEVIFFEEPSIEVTQEIIEKRYAENKDIQISKETIKNVISLAQRFIHDKFLPESALSLIDDATSQAKIEGKKEIVDADIKKILAQKTGIPIEDITEKEAQDLQNLDDLLKKSVIGQDEAVNAVSKTIKRSRSGLRDPKRPIGSFLFLGPSGVGKTQLAKALSKIIYKDENAMIRLDMSEYTDAHTVDRLIGAPPGYIGYEEGGQLTNKVLKRPYSLILLDEVEKANPKVFDIFLQVLDDGRLTDGQGKTVDFKNTIIIMTSNLTDDNSLHEFFRTEFLNRIDQVIKFKGLNAEVGKSIVKLFVKDLQTRLLEKNIQLEVSEDVINKIANSGISEKYGARPLRRLVEEKIEDPIVEKIINGEIHNGEKITWNQI